jgi:hypothetical protein
MSRPTITLILPEYRVDEQMGGIGVRALDLATALVGRASVVVVCAHKTDLANLPCPVLDPQETDLSNLITTSDCVIFFDLGNPDLLRLAVQADRYVVVENAVPLEHLEYNANWAPLDRDAAYQGYVRGFLAQVAAADHFLARSEIERRLLSGVLATQGRLSPKDITQSCNLSHLISLVPIGVTARDAKLADSEAFDPNLFLWTGGLWDYMDYQTAIDAFDMGVKGQRLQFMYRPPADQPLRAHADLARAGVGTEPVGFLANPPLHSERGSVIAGANALICLGRPGIENATCVRLRLRDTLLYERPMIVDLYGATGEYVRDTGIGIALAEPDPANTRAAVMRLAEDPDARAACIEAILSTKVACLMDTHITGLLERGAQADWRSQRDRDATLARLRSLVPEEGADAPAPFVT